MPRRLAKTHIFDTRLSKIHVQLFVDTLTGCMCFCPKLEKMIKMYPALTPTDPRARDIK